MNYDSAEANLGSGVEFMRRVVFGFALLFVVSSVRAQSPGQAPTPPMGWNSWNHFAEKVTEADVKSAADALVASGMRDAGYVYVNIDDTWEGKRDAQGVLHTNEKFPDMKGLADYVHARGLKLGIYSSPGPKTCAGYEGSYGHEQQDADLYASWGIDYLKYDLCSLDKMMKAEPDKAKANALMIGAYETMRKALLATHRPIVYSFCQYGWDDVWKWGAATGGNLWRTTGDIEDTYKRMAQIGFSQNDLAPYAGPGHWNDPDMLEVGNGGMSADEYRTHMSLWAILAAPLLAGNDLSKMDEATKSILMNKEVIAVDQDKLGRQGHRAIVNGDFEVWEKPLAGGATAVALFNRSDKAVPLTLDSKQISMIAKAKVRDVWAHAAVKLKDGAYTQVVPAHGVAMYVVQP
jgi:alpha-galactosidase